jgi:cation transport regulator
MARLSETELETRLLSTLPDGAREVYREAFNHAFGRYGLVGRTVARRIAWSAVKRSYEKREGSWVPRHAASLERRTA